MKIICKKIYNNLAKDYHKEPWTVGTIKEIDFIEQELKLTKDMEILDVGCGTDRYFLELLKRGYNVTGINISDKTLNEARAPSISNVHFSSVTPTCQNAS